MSIANGNFSFPGEATDLIHVGHVMVPGWSHHGGGGEGEIVGNSSDGYHLLLSDDGISRTHNLVYVPVNARYLTFKAKRVEADSNDVLVVELGDRYATTMTAIGQLPANVTDTGYRTYSLAIPVALRDQVHNIRFRLADSQGGWLDAEVQIDDIRFTESAIGQILNGVTDGGQLAGTSSQAESGFASVLPLLGANLGSKLGLGNALASTFALPDVSNVTSMAELRLLLETAGFSVQSMLTDEELDALTIGQFADYFHVSRSTTQHLSSQSALDLSAIEAIAGLAGISVSGNLTLEADVTFHYSFGVDSNGFYLEPGSLIEAEIHIGGSATGDLGIFGDITATPDMDLVATLGLSATALVGRIRVEDLLNAFGDHASFSITEVAPDTHPDLMMTYSLGSFLNVPITFSSTHDWDISSAGVTYLGTNWNDAAIQNSVVAMVQGGLDHLKDDARLFANVVEKTPFIGKSLADALTAQIRAALTFSPSAELSATSFSAASLIAGAMNGSLADLSVLEFTYDVHRTSSFSTGNMPSVSFGWDAGGVDLGLTLGSSGLYVTPDLDFHIIFGLDLGRGLYIREGSRIQGSLDVPGTLSGSAHIGDLFEIAVGAVGTFQLNAGILLDDGDSRHNEKLYVLDEQLPEILTDADSFDLFGNANLNLTLAVDNPVDQIPMLGDILPAQLTWGASANYNFAMDHSGNINGTGSYGIGSSNLDLDDIEQQIIDNFLEQLDQYNPLPQSFRDFLTTPISLLGNATLLDLLGLGNYELIVNPTMVLGRSAVELQDPDGNPQSNDGISVSFGSNLIESILSGQPTNLVEMHVNVEAPHHSIPLGQFPTELLASYLGIVNLTVTPNLALDLGMGFDITAGIDTKGFYILENDDIFHITGGITGSLDFEGELTIVPFAQAIASMTLSATGNIGLVDGALDGQKRRGSDFIVEGQLATDLVSVSLGLDLFLGLHGSVGRKNIPIIGDVIESWDAGTKTYHLYTFEVGGSQAGFDFFADAAHTMKDKANDALLTIGAATGNPLLTVVALYNKYGDDIQAAANRAADWAKEQAAAVVDFGTNAAKDLTNAVKDVGKQLSDLGKRIQDEVLGPLASGDILTKFAEALGFNSDRSRDPTEYVKRTFEVKKSGSTLTITWTGEDGADLSIAKKGSTLAIDAPDFVTSEIIGWKEGYNWHGHYEEEVWGDVEQKNYQEWSLAGISRIEIVGTNDNDVIVVDKNFSVDLKIRGLGGDDMLVGGSGNDEIYGGSGDDTIVGNGGDDVLSGGTGKDTIQGNGGDDEIDAGSGDDYVSGGSGDDTIKGGTGSDTLDGGANDDEIHGGSSNDYIIGGSGNDTIYGDSGNDNIQGGSGNDFIDGGSNDDYIVGDSGDDTVQGGSGDDTIYGDDEQGRRSGRDLLYGGSGNDVIYAGRGMDTLYGEVGADILKGEDDADLIYGGNNQSNAGDANDIIEGGQGNDTIYGGASGDALGVVNAAQGVVVLHVDFIDGGDGDDLLYGQDGKDLLIGGIGDDTLDGGDGDDTLNAVSGHDFLFGGRGNDVLIASGSATLGIGSWLDGGDDNDTLIGSAFNDTLFGGSGNDSITDNEGDDSILGGDGDDTLIGGIGVDTLVGGLGADRLYGGSTLGGTQLDDNYLYGDSQTNPDDANGGNDTIYGELGRDFIYGGAGKDQIFASGGDNEVYGNAGDDHIETGSGTDLIYGGLGSDYILAGLGGDTVYGGVDSIGGGNASDINTIFGDTTDLNNPNGGSDVIYGDIGRDIIRAGNGDNIVHALSGDDDIETGSGSDVIYGGSGSDYIVAGLGADTMYAGVDSLGGGNSSDLNTVYGDGIDPEDPNGGNDLIYGDVGDDAIYAGAGNDSAFALAGNDVVTGNRGQDLLVGGMGNDVLAGGENSDILWGGSANPTWTLTYLTGVPGLFSGVESLPIASVDADPDDGTDNLSGDAGDDWLFGGSDIDILGGGAGQDYIDAGAGNDIDVHGGTGSDLVRGGSGSDVLHGDDDVDLIYGDAGDDYLYGDKGDASGSQIGQALFCGDGFDTLYAYAGNPLVDGDQTLFGGDELHGGADNDTLYGNLRMDSLWGDSGDDFLYGDWLAGPAYLLNPDNRLIGGADLLVGGDDEDRLYGGGGADSLYGGKGSDWLEGQNHDDSLVGGSGSDILVLDASPSYASVGNEAFIGHGTDNPGSAALPDDNATDILLIPGNQGSSIHDIIRVGETLDGRLSIDYTSRPNAIALHGVTRERQPLNRFASVAGPVTTTFASYAMAKLTTCTPWISA